MPSRIYMLLFSVLIVEITFAKLNPPLRRIPSRQDDKLLLRTKRQHCTCLNVRVTTGDAPILGPGLDSLDSTYRCTCNSANNPVQQQRELQQILQQVEPLSHCSCSPGGLTGAPPAPVDSPLFDLQTQQKQWDCNCIGGQTQRPTPPQFFPWNRPVAADLFQEQQSQQGFQNSQNGPPQFQQQFRNDQPTTLPPPSPSLSTPNYLNTNQPQQYLDNPTPLAPLPNELPYRDFNSLNDRPYNSQGNYPEQQTQITSFRIPEGNGIIETFPGPSGTPPKCPCMEVVINVMRTDANGNRYPATQPLCICAPTTNIPSNPRPSPLPISNNDPVRQPLVPPQPQYQPPQSSTPRPLLTPVPNSRGLSPQPSPLPIGNQQAINGNSYYDVNKQPYQPAYSPYYSSPYALSADEPAVMPCIMTITIGSIGPQQCKCQENYRQCSTTHCCNHKTYRSLRADPTTTSATPSAVDLLLEFADRFKKHLEAQAK